ncbi:MAG: M48 family metallopeptidase [Humidesulfovibrio sp.]|nr:M48 family metallopeptidase [Humidesulfovibrio sp.]
MPRCPHACLRPVLLVLGLAFVLVLPLPARAGSALWIAVDQAPMRIWRAAEAEVVLRLPRGTVVTPLYVQAPWTRVREPSGQEGWVYQGHLSATPLPPALTDVFEATPPSLILAEAADTARSTRSAAPPKTTGLDALLAVLELRLTPDDLDDFLSQGGIGEFAQVKPGNRFGRASFPDFRPAAPEGGEAERQVGLNLAARVVRKMAQPASSNALQRYVNLVGLSVARFAPGHAPNFRAVVLDMPEPVSFSLPGGIVMLSTGLLAALENEAQLACVLAHETAHASMGHLWASALQSPFFQEGGKVDQAGVDSPEFAAMLDGLLVTALNKGLARDLEFEADLIAAALAYRAGYDPQQLPKAIARIEEAGRGVAAQGPPRVWAALHPPTAERLARLQKLLVTLPGGDDLAVDSARFEANR